MKLNVINNGHGPKSKAWYTLRPLKKYHHDEGIPTMWGLRLANHRRARECVINDKPWLFCDMPYWGRWNPLKESVSPDGEYYWRTIYKDIHVTKIHEGLPHDRIKNISIKDWRTKGEYILLAPSSDSINGFVGRQNWERETIELLKTKTDMPIKIRYKPRGGAGRSGPAYALVPLADDLAKASCVVTSCSLVGVEAAIEGIPVYSLPRGATWPIAQAVENFGQPNYSEQRKEWLATLGYHQYTHDEIQSGLFKEVMEGLYNEMR